jgi:hypothetical protein
MKKLAAVGLLGVALGASAAVADEHRPERSGHPLAIAGAILHPVGVVLDWVIFRPAHWIAHREPVKTLEDHRKD